MKYFGLQTQVMGHKIHRLSLESVVTLVKSVHNTGVMSVFMYLTTCTYFVEGQQKNWTIKVKYQSPVRNYVFKFNLSYPSVSQPFIVFPTILVFNLLNLWSTFYIQFALCCQLMSTNVFLSTFSHLADLKQLWCTTARPAASTRSTGERSVRTHPVPCSKGTGHLWASFVWRNPQCCCAGSALIITNQYPSVVT